MKHVEIFGFAASTYVRTARMVCEEKRIDYQLLALEFGQDSHRALHPFMRMPVVRVGEMLLYETLAITMYLDEVFNRQQLVPADAATRARMLQWVSTCNDYLYGDLVKALLAADDLPDDTLASGRRDLEIVNRQLLNGPFLLGDEIYLCDLFLAPIVAFVEQQATGPALLGELDALAAWRDRLWSRASFAATQA